MKSPLRPLLALGLVAAALGAAVPGRACSSHGTLAAASLDVRVLGDLDGDGRVEAFVGIEDGFLAPTAATTCIAGIGFGTPSSRFPPGATVTGARVAVVDVVSGAISDLPDFGFAPNGTTAFGLAQGAGPGGPPGTEPLFADASWFGFAASVSPFVPPPLGPDEIFELGFDVELPTMDLPLSIEVQFAAGEGDASGAPLFAGAHPPQYYTAADPVAVFVPEPAPRALAWTSLAAAALLGRRRTIRQAAPGSRLE